MAEGMMPGVDEDGALPLPWLAAPLAEALNLQRSHALLAFGPGGVGQLEFAFTLAQAWLCDQRGNATRPCGRCDSCRLVRGRSHPDLLLVVPDALALQLQWATVEDLRLKGDAKPSKDLRVAQVRDAIDWSQRTPARGKGKALVLHPADAMNHTAASALLKTLEEPPGSLRLVLTSSDPEHLLPTVRSRCQRVRLPLPEPASALAWLQAQDVAAPQVLLALAGGRPLLAWELAAEGIDAALVQALPARLAAGDPTPLLQRPVARVVDLLLKLALDLAVRQAGGLPRYFPAASLPAGAPDAARLAAWQRSLLRVARHDEHPWNAGLLVDALVTEGAALWPRAAAGARRGGAASLHSGA
ncbi:hypothetical protein BurJ1DRAFT_2634 [Burkholderiales bacterium JOSHI_001]|nr:hypothetical protein BurJ1DRAFT_2634 [Burkholderiales bacterium JOSHI_001]